MRARISEFRDVGREDRFSFEQDHTELTLQEEGQSRGTESSERGSVSASDYTDLFHINLRDDDVQEFDARWDEIPLSMTKIPLDDILESLCKLRIRESGQLKSVLELYDIEIHQKISRLDDQNLKTMVRRRIDQTLWLRNFDARHEKIETGAVVKSQKGLSGVEKGKGICYQWKEKEQCSKGDQCCFWHESNDRAKPTPKAAPTSEPQSPKHEVEVCRENETPEAEASLRSSIDRRVNTS